MSLGLCLSALLAPTVGRAEHQNLGQHVTAMVACLPGSATTATSTGIPACPLPEAVSNCGTDPAGALSFVGRIRYLISAFGRNLTRSRSTSDVVIKMTGSGVTRCDGEKFSGALSARLVVRITADDPACAGGRCTLPDVTVPATVTCEHGGCNGRSLALDGPPPPRLPLDVPWTGVVMGFSVLDPVGRPFISPGMIVGRPTVGLGSPFPREARRWVARFVPAYAPCLPGSEDTATSEGVAACANPTPLSDCATDPQNAVKPAPSSGDQGGSPGKGRLELVPQTTRGEAYVYSANFFRLRDCDDNPYSGSLTLVALVRATLVDPACAGGLCTAVDTEVRLPVVAQNGGFKLGHVPFPIAGTFRTGGGASVLEAEILRFDLRDVADHTVLSGPGYLVRCDRASPEGSCFGN